MKHSILFLCLTLTFMNVRLPQVAAFSLGDILKNFNSENLHAIAQDENVQKISNNAKDFVETFANDPSNKQSINTILNGLSGINQLGGSSVDLQNILNGLSNLGGSQNSGSGSSSTSNIVNQFLSALTVPTNNTLDLSQIGSELANFLVTVYVRSLVSPLTNDQIASLITEFVANITNNNQQIIDYVNQKIPTLLSQISPFTSPADILNAINTIMDFSSFMNQNGTSSNSTDVNALINMIMEAIITKDVTTLENYISNLNSDQLRQIITLISDPSVFQTWLKQMSMDSIQQLAQILGNSGELAQVLSLFNSDPKLQAIGTIISQIVQSPQFQELIAMLENGDLSGLISAFNSSSNIIDILMSINSTEWQLLLNIINNPTELENLLMLFNNSGIANILNLLNSSPQIKQLLSMLDISQIQTIIKALNFSINPNGSINLYITTDLQNLISKFFDLQTLGQLLTNFDINNLESFLQSVNLGALNQVFSMFNLTQLEMLHLDVYIPQLIEEIKGANSTSDVIHILEQTLLAHLSFLLNDTSLLNSTNPWLNTVMRIIDMVSQDQQMVAMIESLLGGFDLNKINNLLTFLNNFDMQNWANFIPTDFANIIGELVNLNSLNELFTMFNITIPSWAQTYVDVWLPQLIDNLLRANTPEEMMQILEMNIMSELAMIFNDPSLLNSSNIWMSIATDALKMVLNDAQLMSSLTQYIQQYIQSFNISQLNDIVAFLMNLDLTNLGTLIPAEIAQLVEGLINAQNIGQFLQMFNITIPSWAETILDVYLPQLVSQLSTANSTEEMARIIEQAVLYQVAMMLNDTSILTASNPWVQIFMDVYYMILNDPAILAQIESYIGQFNLTEIEFAILESLVQRYPAIYLDMLMAMLTPDNINYLISFFNLPSFLADHLATYLPQLISQLSHANSTEQMIQILEASILTNLAELFNDPNILVDPMYYILRDLFFAIRDEPQLLDPLGLDPMIENVTIAFLNYYYATNNWKDAFNNVSSEVALMMATMLANPTNAFVNEYMPELAQLLANSTSEQQSMSIIGDFLVAMVRSVFPEMPTTTTPAMTTTAMEPCRPDPCQNGATCFQSYSGHYYCSCPPLYSGVNCSDFVNPCYTNGMPTCLNNAVCMVSYTVYPYYMCTCPPGVSGQNCQITTTTTTTSTTTTTTTTTSTTTTTRPTTTTTRTSTTTTTGQPTTTTSTRSTTTSTRTTVTQTLNSGINNIISSLQSAATTLTAPTRSLQPLRTIIFVKK